MSYTMNTSVSLAATEGDLADCFDKWSVREYDIAYNLPRPRAMRESLNFTRDERAVTVWWKNRQGKTITMAMDRHARPMDNLRVLYLAIESIRMNEKRGIDEALMHSAYLQLTSGDADPYALFKVTPGVSEDEAKAIYRRLARAAHPDTGGSNEEMARVNQAWTALAEREGWS